MGYASLRACVDDLAAAKRLVRIDAPVDPHLEVAEIQRRVYQAGGPAILFNRVKGCRFRMVSNLFGTLEYPILMHCKSGADRVGLMSALYLHTRHGVPISEARRQLSLR